ncbi:MAG: prephenate dehydratase [Gammaproteobacteria bacterium]|nr:prephenate dehydratase [Gammaproteobacteria bacterium]
MNDNDELQQIRERIDSLDLQIQDLINQRAEAAQEVARVKRAEDKDAFFYRPEREAQVLATVKQRNLGPVGDEEMTRLFREIMSTCLALEQPLHVAFLGPEGTFTQAAALKHFGHSVETVAMGSIPDIFRDVESGACHYGVVPVENSTEGVISHTLDMFLNSGLQICGEVTLRIHHHLLSKGGDLSSITKVYSHQQSLAQCRLWLDRNLHRAEQQSVGSNAEAARLASNDPQSAAIAGEMAAEIYGLGFLAESIEDEPDNTTRFLIIGRQSVAASGNDKTTMLLSARNVAGSLNTLLRPLSEHSISMTRIESRPSRRGTWDYVFFIDIHGHMDDPNVAQAMQELRADASLFKVLGSYPIAVL